MGSTSSRSLSSPCLDEMGVSSRIKSRRSYHVHKTAKKIRRMPTMKNEEDTDKPYHMVFMERLERRRNQKSFLVHEQQSDPVQSFRKLESTNNLLKNAVFDKQSA